MRSIASFALAERHRNAWVLDIFMRHVVLRVLHGYADGPHHPPILGDQVRPYFAGAADASSRFSSASVAEYSLSPFGQPSRAALRSASAVAR